MPPERRFPTVRGRQLARELRTLRTANGLTGDHLARELGWSPAKISRIETARTLITPSDLRKILALYEVGEAVVERLMFLARTANDRGWWQPYADSLVKDYATYIGLENDAAFMHNYHMTVIPGILQSKSYARAIIVSGGPLPHGEVERRINLRMKRQERLESPNALEVWAVLDEAVLRRKMGGNDLMYEQLGSLLELSDRPNINLQVLRDDSGPHSGIMGTFVVFGFEHPDDPNVVALETHVGHLIIEDEVQVFRYDLAFDELREKALNVENSIELISRIANEYKD
jgi:transcriptional regulator with XRE-family HTH domain